MLEIGVLLLLAVRNFACPDACKCIETTVDCSFAGLTSVPEFIPPNTISLDLRGNHLRTVKAEEFRVLGHLEELDLSSNRLESIPEDLLEWLPLLKKMSLSNNQLQKLPSLSSRRLVQLDASHNQIQQITSLRHLNFLVKLDVSNNQLRYLSPGSIGRRITVLRLNNNPWHCDCRATWLLDDFDELALGAICAYPPEMNGKRVGEVEVDRFACESPAVTYNDFSTKLSCSQVDNTEISWIYDGAPLDVETESWVSESNGELLIPTSAAISDFQCTHDYGISKREKRHIRDRKRNAGKAPSFVQKPRDGQYRESATVRLYCSVEATPAAQYTWTYKGQTLMNSRRHELLQDGAELKIFPFMENDVGTYTCTAFNVHGSVSHSAHLGLVSSTPPVIYDAPVTTTASLGQQQTFRCRARGIPPPQISWLFEGAPVRHSPGRFHISSNGEELTISKASRQFEGRYTCVATSSVGTVSTDAQLTVAHELFEKVDSLVDKDTLASLTETAKQNVDRAFLISEKMKKEPISSPEDFKELFRFSASANQVEVTKAREIYEESLRLVYEYVNNGLKLPVDQLAPNVSYEAVLPVSYIQTLMELSGCQTGQVLHDSCWDTCFHSRYRTYDGQCNNIEHPYWGAAAMPLLRHLPPIYENGFNQPVGWNAGRLYRGYPMPNARDVSRAVISTETITPHPHFSLMVMQWGQWVDHDITFTALALSRQSYTGGAICNRTCDNNDPCFNIQLSKDDPKLNIGRHIKYPCIEMERNGAVCGSGETSLIFQRVTYRDQMNTITSFLDGSGVYGSEEQLALELRDLYADHGLLRFDIVSAAQKPYMPFEHDTDERDCRRNFSAENPIHCFLAGDARANEQLALMSLHTVFLREHNRIAGKLLEINVNWDGETIFQEARKIVGAIIQHVTYNDWLPAVLGKNGFAELIGEYRGYDANVNPSIANAFATAAMRFGHTLINPVLLRLDKNYSEIAAGHIPLHLAFFAPERLLSEGGVDPLLRGLWNAYLKLPRTDQPLNSHLTERLFTRFHEVALDLAAVNIQRGRDHALPGWVEYRRWCNLSVPESWQDLVKIVPDLKVRTKLQSLYGHVANIDLFVGGVLEKRLADALMGPTFSCIIGDQFRRLRDGDRFWYENEGVFTKQQLQQIKKVTVARLFCDNGDDIDRVPRDVFYRGTGEQQLVSCSEIPEIKLRMWMDCCEGGQCNMRSKPIQEEAFRRRRSANFAEHTA